MTSRLSECEGRTHEAVSLLPGLLAAKLDGADELSFAPGSQVPSGYKPSGIDIGCLSQAMGACPKGFFDCRGLCYTVAQRATMGPSKFSGEGQGIEMRCGACAKSRVAFLGGQDPGLANAFGNVAKALNRPVRPPAIA